jgi:hypothetical protein
MSTAEKLREQGRAEGRTEGRAEVLLKVLMLRFGPIPAGTAARIRGGSIEELERGPNACSALAASTRCCKLADASGRACRDGDGDELGLASGAT